MSITNRRTTSLYRRLNTVLRSNPAFGQLAQATDNVIRKLVTEPRTQLTTLRDPRLYHRGEWVNTADGRRAIINHLAVQDDGSLLLYAQIANSSEVVEIALPTNTQERSLLVNNVRMHGFNYFSDTLSTDDYLRISEWLEYYWPQSGTQNYVNFIGFIKHLRFFSDTLWTTNEGQVEDGVALVDDPNDEYPFLEPDFGDYSPVWQGGPHYPTSHVQLRYDIIDYPAVDEEDLVRLFYLLAPIELVLQRIAHDINTDAIKLFTTVVGSLALHDGGTLEKEVISAAKTRVAYLPRLGCLAGHEGGMLRLSAEELAELLGQPNPTGALVPVLAL